MIYHPKISERHVFDNTTQANSLSLHSESFTTINKQLVHAVFHHCSLSNTHIFDIS